MGLRAARFVRGPGSGRVLEVDPEMELHGAGAGAGEAAEGV